MLIRPKSGETLIQLEETTARTFDSSKILLSTDSADSAASPLPTLPFLSWTTNMAPWGSLAHRLIFITWGQ